MKPAELRRAHEELVNAYRTLESQNAKLREENKKLRLERGAVSPTQPKFEPPSVREGSLVNYVDERGHEHLALVKKSLDLGMLRLRVFRQARNDLVLDVAPCSDGRTSGWRRR